MKITPFLLKKLRMAVQFFNFWGEIDDDLDKLWVEFPHNENYHEDIVTALEHILSLDVPSYIRVAAAADILLMMENEEYATKCNFKKDLFDIVDKHPKSILLLFDWKQSLLGQKFWEDLNRNKREKKGWDMKSFLLTVIV